MTGRGKSESAAVIIGPKRLIRNLDFINSSMIRCELSLLSLPFEPNTHS